MIDKRFERLLRNRSRAGDQALAYLSMLYIGEGRTDLLECEIINRGKRMVRWLRAYTDCQPLIGLEPLPIEIDEGGVAHDLLTRLESGLEKHCAFGP